VIATPDPSAPEVQVVEKAVAINNAGLLDVEFFRVGGEEYPVGDRPPWPWSSPLAADVMVAHRQEGLVPPRKRGFRVRFTGRKRASPCGDITLDDKHAGVSTMGAKADETKGRVKEAAGALSGDDRLRREGQLDRAAATAKGKVREAGEKLEEVIDWIKDKASPDANKSAKDRW
jgi:uncharacterized protein YjbJ (UPF0337 family)